MTFSGEAAWHNGYSRYMKKTRRQQRFEAICLAGIIDVDYLIDELHRHRQEITIEPWMIEELAKGERSIRRYRLHLEALLADEPRTCARCRQPIAGRADRKFCSDACRIAAHRVKRRRATALAVDDATRIDGT